MKFSLQTSDEHFRPLQQASLSSYDPVNRSLAKIYDVVTFMQKRASFTTRDYGFDFLPFSFDVGLCFRGFFTSLVCIGVLLGAGMPSAFAEEDEPPERTAQSRFPTYAPSVCRMEF